MACTAMRRGCLRRAAGGRRGGRGGGVLWRRGDRSGRGRRCGGGWRGHRDGRWAGGGGRRGGGGPRSDRGGALCLDELLAAVGHGLGLQPALRVELREQRVTHIVGSVGC